MAKNVFGNGGFIVHPDKFIKQADEMVSFGT